MVITIPLIGVTGLYSVLSPFNASVNSSIPHTCIGVRTIADILAAGGDPYSSYYSAFGLTKEIFQNDVTSGVAIVSLQSPNGNVFYVPSSYINSFPDIGGVPYTVLALAVELGALPDSLDLTFLKQRIVDVVKETIGVDTTVHTVAVSNPSLIPYNDSRALEAARNANISIVKTDHAMYLEEVNKNNLAVQRIAELEKYIMDNLVPLT